MDSLSDWQREQYAPEEYNFEPEMMACGHNMNYRCQHCGKCYACRHKSTQRGDGTVWWKCWNGKQHQVKGL